MTALARASSSFKRQNCSLVRESAPHEQTHNCLTVTKIWSKAPDVCFIPRQTDWLTDWLTVGRNIRLRLRLTKEKHQEKYNVWGTVQIRAKKTLDRRGPEQSKVKWYQKTSLWLMCCTFVKLSTVVLPVNIPIKLWSNPQLTIIYCRGNPNTQQYIEKDCFEKSQNYYSTGDSRTEYLSWPHFHKNCPTWASQIQHPWYGCNC
jgi:hypothetical protein